MGKLLGWLACVLLWRWQGEWGSAQRELLSAAVVLAVLDMSRGSGSGSWNIG